MNIAKIVIVYPIRLYKTPSIEINFAISTLSPFCRGSNNKKLIAAPTPNSAKFKSPNILFNVPVKPRKLFTSSSKNIFLEKNANYVPNTKKSSDTLAFFTV